MATVATVPAHMKKAIATISLIASKRPPRGSAHHANHIHHHPTAPQACGAGKNIYELHALDKDASGPVLIVPAEASDVLMRVRDVGLCFDRDTPESEHQVRRLTDALMQVAIKDMEVLYEAS